MDNDRIEAILRRDPIWAGYALADLQPRFAPNCQWVVGERAETEAAQDGLVLFFDLLTPTAIVTVGGPDAVAAALAKAELPDEIYLNVRYEHLPHVAEHYEFLDGTTPYWRMYLPAEQTLPQERLEKAVRLHALDVERVRQLYSHGGPFTPDAFDGYQLADGMFFGVQGEDGALLAAGGTHIISREQRVAAIGNMYTRPDARGRGLAGLVLRAIVVGLRGEEIETIILNVAAENEAAQRLYERHGFVVHCPYFEGIGSRRK